MKPLNMDVLVLAQEFTARWGFLTQDIFFDFFCPMSQAQQYRYWAWLVDQGYFYKSNANPQVLLLTKKSRVLFGRSARPSRLPTYVPHDAVVARVFLALHQRGLIVRSWLEDELMRNPIDAYTVLGAERIHRVPDLVFDLRTADSDPVRCVLEIERITKSQGRYSKIALAYLGCTRVSVILFGCGQDATERAIRTAFSGKEFTSSNRVPGLFQYKEFDKESLQGKIRFQNNEFSMQQFLEIATKAPVPKITLLRENNEKTFSLKKSKNLEAA